MPAGRIAVRLAAVGRSLAADRRTASPAGSSFKLRDRVTVPLLCVPMPPPLSPSRCCRRRWPVRPTTLPVNLASWGPIRVCRRSGVLRSVRCPAASPVPVRVYSGSPAACAVLAELRGSVSESRCQCWAPVLCPPDRLTKPSIPTAASSGRCKIFVSREDTAHSYHTVCIFQSRALRPSAPSRAGVQRREPPALP